MDHPNPYFLKTILQVVANQLRMNKPPETRETLNRLISEGYSEKEAKKMIGAVVAAHIYHMLKEQHEFDNETYVAALKRLPKLPSEE
ncbi:MAG: DUF1841 family protein [bacterium]